MNPDEWTGVFLEWGDAIEIAGLLEYAREKMQAECPQYDFYKGGRLQQYIDLLHSCDED